MIYGALARVLFPVAVVGLIGAGMWGYQEHNEKNSILIKAENQYQRAFHDLNYHIDKLHDELGKSMVVNTRKQITPCLTNVWRLAYSAQSDVGQLPLTLMPFNNTEEFLSKVADFSYGVAVRDLTKEPLTQKEYQTLKSLYQHSSKIRNELNHVQTKVIDKQLRWMDVETALASDDKKTDNTIIDGFKTIDKTVQEFPEVDWGTSIQSADKKKKQRIKGLPGKRITKEEAGRIAREFMAFKTQAANLKMEVDENGKSTEYSAYSVRFEDGNVDPVMLDVTKQGGKVVWMLTERDIKKPALSLDEAEAIAGKYLKDRGFSNMVASESDVYEGLGVFTFVHQQNGVRIYPDAVTVKVALDNGQVYGFHAEEYWFNHKQRVLPKATVSAQKAKSMVNPAVKVTGQRMALIQGKNDGKEVLCYEYTVEFEGNTYNIFINAQTGQEEEVMKMETEEIEE